MLKWAFLKSPKSAEQRWGIGYGAHAQKRTGMSLWLHSGPEAHAGLAANPAKGKCWAQGSGASGEQWRTVLIYASGPVPFQPQNLSFAFLLSTCPKPFIPSLPWSFLRMLPHALVPKSQTSYPDYLVNCTSWLLLHLNCTLPRNTPPTSANTCYPH